MHEIVVGPSGRAHVQEVGGPITIEASISGTISDPVSDTIVNNGDLIVCDESGCVAIPPAISNQILDAARRYAEAELETVRSLLRREPLTVAYLHKKKIVQSIIAELGRP
jgi:regulator of RNase E activity RraA